MQNIIYSSLDVIQFPDKNGNYKDYSADFKNITKLPELGKEFRYGGFKKNDHHYTTRYHREYVLPMLSKLLEIHFNLDDFELKENIVQENDNKFDLSYLVPKVKYEYKIHCYELNKDIECEYENACGISYNKDAITPYHSLYAFPHMCSKIENLTTKSDLTLFISGDSQMIPSIMPLSTYFKKLYYFDNRSGNSEFTEVGYQNTKSFITEPINVDKVLISLHELNSNKYIKINFK